MRSAARRLMVAAMCFASSMSAEAYAAVVGFPATNGDPLAIARALFADALVDEDAGRYGDALDKFRRVRDVRDTAPVEYRIGTCYDALAQPVPAYLAYRRAVALGGHDADADADAAAVVQASSTRLDALRRIVARLQITLASVAATEVEVRIDGALVDVDALDEPVPLSPGMHAVTAVAREHAPFRADIPLSAGADTAVTIALSRSDEGGHARTPLSAAPGWAVAAGGATLLAASAILLVARHAEIAALDRACPGGVCPTDANRAELEAKRSRALVEGPLAVGCGAAGAVAMTAGAMLVLRANRSPNADADSVVRLSALGLRGAGVVVGGSFR